MAVTESHLPTLVDLSLRRVEEEPEAPLYRFLADGETEAACWTRSDLDRRARRWAARLRRHSGGGERALLVFPPGLELLAAFFGCLYADVVAVPCYPPRRRGDERFEAIVGDCGPRWLLSEESSSRRLESVPAAAGPRTLLAEELEEGSEEEWRHPGVKPDTLAFLQYTSGSTSLPKGVRVTHRNLLYNEELIRRAFRQERGSTVVSWLPVYHDMGLIGAVLQPLFCGGQSVLFSPHAFLQRPARWLEAISRYGADTSGGPNFAYDLCCDRVDDETRASLDLQRWRVAFNGAEPVRPETLERFARAFAPCGFSSAAFVPCYGLAEATLLVSGAMGGAATLEVSSTALEQDRVEPSRGDGRFLASSGPAAPGLDVRVVDPKLRVDRRDGEVGEIWIAGDSVADGYWGRSEETEHTFRGFLADGRGPFLRSGDLGFLQDGRLFVTGRLKDLVIIRGRNVYPHDLERTALASHPDLRLGGGAAFAVEVEGAERLVLVLERVRTPRGSDEDCIRAVRSAVAEVHEVQVHEVVLVRPATVPRTSSGKVRRSECRRAWLHGELAVVARSGPLGGEGSGDEESGAGAEAGVEPGGGLLAHLGLLASARLGGMSVDPTVPLSSYGLDSLSAVELQADVAVRFGAAPALSDLLAGATLEDLAEAIREGREGQEGSAGGKVPALEPPRRLGPVETSPLSYGQQALWFLERLAPEGGAYHVTVLARFRQRPDLGRLGRALLDLTRRHEVLRTGFHEGDGAPFQRVQDRPGIDLAIRRGGGKALGRWQAREAVRPFDLARPPLLRVRLAPDDGEAGSLLLVAHHLVCDFASLARLGRELAELYAGSTPEDRPAAGLAHADYVAWEREQVEGEAGRRAWDYWRRRLDGAPVLELPTDRPRPPVQTYRGGRGGLRIDGGTADGLARLAEDRRTSLYPVLLAAFATLLHRYGAGDDVVVGSPASGRFHPRLADLVGYLVRPLPLRVGPAAAMPFEELVTRCRDAVAEALEHQVQPFLLLAERLQPRRDPSRSPLFQTLLVHYPERRGEAGEAAFAAAAPGAGLALGPGLELEAVAPPEPRSQFDLTLSSARLHDGGLWLSLTFNRDLFDATTGHRLLRHLEVLLREVVGEPHRSLGGIPLSSVAERHQLLREWALGDPDPAPPGSLPASILEQARRRPDALAVEAEDGRLSYGGLVDEAGRLATLLAARGAGPGRTVGVHLRRGRHLPLALLAVWFSGAAYVPLDPRHPARRLSAVMEDAACALLLTEESLDGSLPEHGRPTVRIGDPLPAERLHRRPDPEGLAYLIFTSGSTGRPKGVAIEHRSAAALARWARRAYGDEELAGVLASTSVGFDLSVFELFVPLALGGTVILAEDALAFPTLAAASRVTLVNTVPSVMAELVARDSLPPSVLTVNLAGEPLSRALAERVHRAGAVRLLNLYGPSEDTTYSTGCEVPEGLPGEPGIGRPLPATRAYVVDRRLEPVPPGVVGELLLAGEGTARGYHGRPALTASRFRPDPFHGDGERLYRTGDLARWNGAGELLFLGRADRQVKIRGFRIEPGEVEVALVAHPAVREAVVTVAGDSGDPFLAAYLVAEGEAVEPAELRRFLARTLPDYMLPAAWSFLSSMPRTPHGKIDRRALPEPERFASEPSAAAPRGPLEALLAGLWSQLLGVSAVGRHDDFFACGGHSLMAVRLVTRLRESLRLEVPVAVVFRHPTPAGLAEWIAAHRSSAVAAPGSRPRPGGGPALSFAQRRLWLLHQVQPDTAAYDMTAAVELRGPLDRGALEQALAEIVRRHEVLRTVFPARNGEPVAVVLAAAPPPLPLVDLAALPAPRAAREAASLAAAEAARPFDLARGPLLRLVLVRRGPEDHDLVLNLHHVVADGDSLDVLHGELADLYSAARRGEGGALPEPRLQFGDFARWQREVWEGEDAAAALEPWLRRLRGAPALELPTDRPRPPVQRLRGALVRVPVGESLAAGLRDLAGRLSATPFSILMAALQVLLVRHGGGRDLVVGTPQSQRDLPELEGMVGFFVNMLALRARLRGVDSFAATVAAVQEEWLSAWDHRHVPFERVVEALDQRPDLSRNPVFQVTLSERVLPDPVEAEGLVLSPRPVHGGTSKFDLAFFADPAAGGELAVEYDRDLFDGTTARRLLEGWCRLLEAVVTDPQRAVADLPLLSAAECHQVVREWSDTNRAIGAAAVHRQVEDRAAQGPDRVAVRFDAQAWTYGELDRLAARWAGELVRRGVGADDVVAVLADRSPLLVVALLAVLKAGAAYLPLDPAYPDGRIGYMVQQSGARVVLATGAHGGRLTAPSVLDLDGTPPPRGGPLPPACRDLEDSLAYVIFTSGSTGIPKGVAVSHRGLRNLVAWHRWEYGLAPEHRTSQLASPGFDAAVWEIWSSLAAGAVLDLVPPERVADAAGLVPWLQERRITHAFLPTPLAEAVLSEPLPPDLPLEVLLTGGDRLRRRPSAAARFTLVNHYGPTEASVVTTRGPVAAGEGRGGRLPSIGRPLPNLSVRLLDRRLQPVPLGAPGEICITGEGLARGYLGRPAATAEAFVPDPLGGSGDRLYRTGDRARFRCDGSLDFLGRSDHQVQIRGFRIELGEIEAVLAACPGVREAAVEARESRGGGERVLVAYVALADGTSPADLRDHLGRHLPVYMVPAAWVSLDELPRSAHGKLDRTALPDPAELAGGADPEPPRTDLEALLVEIWEEVLGVEGVGIRDDFFALGGHSLQVTRLVSLLRDELGAELTPRQVLEAPTVAAQAVCVARSLLGQSDAGEAAEALRAAAAPSAGNHDEDRDEGGSGLGAR